jgi:hypothetical protein
MQKYIFVNTQDYAENINLLWQVIKLNLNNLIFVYMLFEISSKGTLTHF